MEESRFDLLLRKAAQQTSRRKAFCALIGGALLLGHADAGEATKEAERRKKRKRQQRSTVLLKDVSFWVNNRAGTRTTWGPYGLWYDRNSAGHPERCRHLGNVNLNQGDAQRYFFNFSLGYVWLNDMYWFHFDNRILQRPTVSAAVGGKSSLATSYDCHTLPGTDVVGRVPLDVGRETSITMNGKVFRVKRHKDTSSNKIFEIIVPPGI